MRLEQRRPPDDDGLAELEAIGGGLGSLLAGSTLERALIGLVIGLAVGLTLYGLRRLAHGSGTARELDRRLRHA